MLIVLNGAQKGGSTWLVQLTQTMVPAKRVPPEFQDSNFKTSSIDISRLDDFLAQVNWRDETYLAKQHWSTRKKALALSADPDTRFVNIIRDIRDVFVSRRHHDIRIGQANPDHTLLEYYIARGREMMDHYSRYQIFWHRDVTPPEAEPLLLSYEGLKTRFEDEVRRLARFLDLDENAIDYADLKARTDVSRKVRPDGFFRKATVGDWVNHFTPELADLLEKQVRENGYFDLVRRLVDRGMVAPDSLLAGNWADQVRDFQAEVDPLGRPFCSAS